MWLTLIPPLALPGTDALHAVDRLAAEAFRRPAELVDPTVGGERGGFHARCAQRRPLPPGLGLGAVDEAASHWRSVVADARVALACPARGC